VPSELTSGQFYRAKVARVDVEACRAYVDIGTPRHALLSLSPGQTLKDGSEIVVCIEQLPTAEMPPPRHVRVRLVVATQLDQQPLDLRPKPLHVRRGPQSMQQQLLAILLIAVSMSTLWWWKY